MVLLWLLVLRVFPLSSLCYRFISYVQLFWKLFGQHSIARVLGGIWIRTLPRNIWNRWFCVHQCTLMAGLIIGNQNLWQNKSNHEIRNSFYYVDTSRYKVEMLIRTRQKCLFMAQDDLGPGGVMLQLWKLPPYMSKHVCYSGLLSNTHSFRTLH